MDSFEQRRLKLENAELKFTVDSMKKGYGRAAARIIDLNCKLAAAKELLVQAVDNAEFSDKIIHGGDGSTWQNWVLTIYLPVPVGSGKSARNALDAAIGEGK